jgi:hypothetical protein
VTARRQRALRDRGSITIHTPNLLSDIGSFLLSTIHQSPTSSIDESDLTLGFVRFFVNRKNLEKLTFFTAALLATAAKTAR